MISHKQYLSVSLRWSDGIAIAALVDRDYPTRVAFAAISEIHTDFRSKVNRNIWQTVQGDNECGYKEVLKTWIAKYQVGKEIMRTICGIEFVERYKILKTHIILLSRIDILNVYSLDV